MSPQTQSLYGPPAGSRKKVNHWSPKKKLWVLPYPEESWELIEESLAWAVRRERHLAPRSFPLWEEREENGCSHWVLTIFSSNDISFSRNVASFPLEWTIPALCSCLSQSLDEINDLEWWEEWPRALERSYSVKQNSHSGLHNYGVKLLCTSLQPPSPSW